MGDLKRDFPAFFYSAFFLCILFSTSIQNPQESFSPRESGATGEPNAAGCTKTFENPTEEFDYIVLGGGTAGLAVASRLSQDPKITVLVLEAGGTDIGNTGISIPGLAGSTFRSSVDWNYSTVALDSADHRSIIYPRGKVVGGSSALNFLLAVKASRADYDAIEKLGNTGWKWSAFDRASKKSENFVIPKVGKNFSFVESDHGSAGLVKTSFPKYLPPHFSKYFPAAKQAGHVASEKDTFGGDAKGPYYFASTINEKSERVTSATAYFYPFSSRKNIILRMNSEVDRLLTSNETKGKVVIQGVRYSSQGCNHQVTAKKEVILSAGVIGSPAILERSGMGDPSILKPLKIPVVVDLPGVGANLIDHPWIWSNYKLRPGVITADKLTNNKTFAAEQMQLYTSKREGMFTFSGSLVDFQPMSGFLTPTEIAEGEAMLSAKSTRMDASIFEIVKGQITSGTPIEFLMANSGLDAPPGSNGSYVTISVALEYPLSRGTSHINSPDPTKPPSFDPGYYRNPFDLWLLAKAAKHTRKIMNNGAWKDVVMQEETPGPQVNTDEEWSQYVRKTATSIYHGIGTAAMLPKNKGGVVDSDLRVYGTTNLRVIDASVIPIHLAMHPQMTVYAIAELGAQKILNSNVS